MTSPSGKAIDVVSEIHCKNNAKDVEKDSDYEIYEKIDINETKTYIPDEIYEKFFSLLDDDCTFEEAFKKSEINQYMTDKEDIENFKRDVEEVRDIFKKTYTFLKENEKFLMDNPEILNPLKEKLLSIQEEIEEMENER